MSDQYQIYQLKKNAELDRFRFEGMTGLERMGVVGTDKDPVRKENYDLKYMGDLDEVRLGSQDETLESIFEKFNLDRPADFKGHSLSVGDVIVLLENGTETAHFTDRFGFVEIPMFLEVLERLANDIENFTYDTGPDGYLDDESFRKAEKENIKESIESGNGAYIQDWLQCHVEVSDIFMADRAKELIDRIEEYKPLAKVEELEEQNYNMIDNVLNNGAGEKEQKRKEKNGEIGQSERPSLKSRLEEKQGEAANQSISAQLALNDKKTDREVI